jgi:signal transduction histidine kinase
MSTSARWPRPSAFDIALAVVLYGMTLLSGYVGRHPKELTAASAAFGTVVCAALIFRRRFPVTVLAVATGCALGAMFVDRATGPFLIGVVIAAFTVATLTDRLTAYVAGGFAAVVLAGGAMLMARHVPWSAPEHTILAVWTALATAIGDTVRNRRAYVAAVEERALRAEQTREEEARRQVAEERLRIARELHDVVAHHIALINVQSGVASHLLEQDPAAAQEALVHVRKASRTVLDELGVLLGVLRESGELDGPAEPAPGLHRLDSLVDGFSAAGLAVRQTVSGAARPLPPVADLTAYRIVQESLTNVHKHGGGAPANVLLAYGDRELMIEVSNHVPVPVPDDPALVGALAGGLPAESAGPVPVPANGNRTGHGLVGMRERATAVGGRLEAGRVDGGFRVRAWIPLPAD